ncbi:hypothetical protein, partial [Vibrio tasmaniensis]|uniref:hypothetical protein n=1 Tax=Vibrio tasmaniensis TaxID=212663 RepID=UPI000373ED25
MKLNKFMLSALLGMTMSTSVTYAATSESVDLVGIVEQSELTPEELVAQLIAQYPEMAAAIVETVVTANPEAAEAVVTAAVTAQPEQAASIVEAAVAAEPESAEAVSVG